MNRDKNGRFVSKELVIGDKITSFDQLKEGMIVNFWTPCRTIEGAIIVFHDNLWYAVHNCDHSYGGFPKGHHAYGCSKGWCLGNKNDYRNFDFFEMIFCGWHKDVNAEKVVEKKELSIGDKITSLDQLKEGMIIDFEANAHVDIGFDWIKVNNAILVRDMDSYGNWYACHDNGRAHGDRPFNNLTIKDRLIKMFNKKYSWRMILSDINEDGEFADSRNIIFKGYYSSLKDDKKVEEVKPKYKINDIVLVRESLINDNRCCCRITNYIKDHGYTLSVLTTPHPLHIYNFKEENIIKKIGVFVED